MVCFLTCSAGVSTGLGYRCYAFCTLCLVIYLGISTLHVFGFPFFFVWSFYKGFHRRFALISYLGLGFFGWEAQDESGKAGCT